MGADLSLTVPLVAGEGAKQVAALFDDWPEPDRTSAAGSISWLLSAGHGHSLHLTRRSGYVALRDIERGRSVRLRIPHGL